MPRLAGFAGGLWRPLDGAPPRGVLLLADVCLENHRALPTRSGQLDTELSINALPKIKGTWMRQPRPYFEDTMLILRSAGAY